MEPSPTMPHEREDTVCIQLFSYAQLVQFIPRNFLQITLLTTEMILTDRFSVCAFICKCE